MGSCDNDGGVKRRRHRRIALAGGVAGVAVFIVVLFRVPLWQGNLGVVDPGRVFRTAQPGKDLSRTIRALRIASILNLRGGSQADPWYLDEVCAARQQGVDFYDLPLSATQRPSRRTLLVLLDLFDHCRYPLLIHCKSGSDRTGLVSGLYLMARCGEPPDRALRAFSLRHGHIPLLGPERLHEPFVEYGAWLAAHGLVHTPERLRAWVQHGYQADDGEIDVPRLPTGPRRLHELTDRPPALGPARAGTATNAATVNGRQTSEARVGELRQR